MDTICNFGVNELPDKVPFSKDFEPGDFVALADFDDFYRNYEMSVRNDAVSNPDVQIKIDRLCKRCSADDLTHSINDLEWSELTAKRNYREALKDGCDNASHLSELKAKMEAVLIKLTVLRLALEQKELLEGRNVL